jgi:hypothetical protein
MEHKKADNTRYVARREIHAMVEQRHPRPDTPQPATAQREKPVSRLHETATSSPEIMFGPLTQHRYPQKIGNTNSAGVPHGTQKNHGRYSTKTCDT